MQVLLAENIRQFRQGKRLTQEQLAEVLDVTVGTISKWETGSSTPDLSLIMELADFFGTSVDVLLGYRQQSVSLADTLEQLRTLRNTKQYGAGRREAEKAVKRFPNSFDVIYQSASLWQVAGLEENDSAASRRAEDLYRRALDLIDQNTDPKISRVSICNDLAIIALSLNELDRAVELLKQNNVEGLNNALIGQTLARRTATRGEARLYLEKALLKLPSLLLSTCMGCLNVAESGSPADAREARELAQLACGLFEGLKRPGSTSPLDKYTVVLYCGCAIMSEKQGLAGQAEADLRAAFTLTQQYDSHPASGLQDILFVHPDLAEAVSFDDLGPTAYGGVEKILRDNAEDYPRLLNLWEGFCHESN